ncbi:MAG: phytoene desaturase [Bacteroidia bacterium]|nr:phytoene desaturase [Bacteroidia bacterium]
MKKKVVVIGSGFAGLSAAACLAKDGFDVTLLEKNSQTGGRASIWQKDGFTFDMGPSWYWMPEVFEEFFNNFGKSASDYYHLVRLDPGYRINFANNESIDVPADYDSLLNEFEKREPGSANQLNEFLKDAEYKYKTAMADYVTRISNSFTEFLETELIIKSFQLSLFSSLRKAVRKRFKNPQLISLLEFPVLFLGSTPDKTPALYSMMNYADLVKGTWYPMGGMHSIVKGFTQVAEEQGVKVLLNHEVTSINSQENKVISVSTNKGDFEADFVVSGADYRHTEQVLLNAKDRIYTEKYWENRTMSPSSLLYFIGVDIKIPNLLHHTLFFDEDFEDHAKEIYEHPRWPKRPLFYMSASSKTDPSVAPEGQENLVLLIPLAPGLKDSEEEREKYFHIMMDRLEARVGVAIREHIVVKRSYAMKNFEEDYHSFKGNAYGLANTLLQTAFLKPKMKHARLKNLLFTGQLTVPGPGVPPAIISGQMAAKEIKRLNSIYSKI